MGEEISLDRAWYYSTVIIFNNDFCHVRSPLFIGTSFLDLLQISDSFPQFPLPDVLEWVYHGEKDEVKDKMKKQSDKKSKEVSFKIDSSSRIDKEQLGSPLEIFAPLFGCHQEFMLNKLKRRRALGMKRKFEVMDDPIDNLKKRAFVFED